MSSFEFTGTMDLSANAVFSLKLAGDYIIYPNSTVITFDTPISLCFDMNIVGTNTAGTLDVFFQNDNPITNTYPATPVISYVIASGTYADGKKKATLNPGYTITTKYMAIRWTKTSGTGTLNIQGVRAFK